MFIIKTRSSHRRRSIKKVFLKISQNLHENSCVRGFSCEFYEMFKGTFLQNTSGRLLLKDTSIILPDIAICYLWIYSIRQPGVFVCWLWSNYLYKAKWRIPTLILKACKIISFNALNDISIFSFETFRKCRE